jgi:hypothetical protein
VVACLGSFADVYGERAAPTFTFIDVVRWVSGELQAKDDVAELLWFDRNAMPDNLAFAQRQAVAALRVHVRRG